MARTLTLQEIHEVNGAGSAADFLTWAAAATGLVAVATASGGAGIAAAFMAFGGETIKFYFDTPMPEATFYNAMGDFGFYL